MPYASTIERLANAFFQGLTGGAPPASPAVPASPPAPWLAPAQPSAPVTATVLPVQPPFGAPDIPTNGVPSSVPAALVRRGVGRLRLALRLRPVARGRARRQSNLDRRAAGRSAPVGRAADAAARSRSSPEAHVPTPGASAAPSALSLSPFSAPLDLSAALNAFAAATNSGYAAAPSVPGFATVSPPESAVAIPVDPVPWRADPRPGAPIAAPGSSASIPVDPVPWRADPGTPGFGSGGHEPASSETLAVRPADRIRRCATRPDRAAARFCSRQRRASGRRDGADRRRGRSALGPHRAGVHRGEFGCADL